MSAYMNALREEGSKEDVLIQLEAKLAEIERLRAFAHFVLRDGPWQGGDVDGVAAQDKAEELGLIELRPCDRKDSIAGETEHYFPVWLQWTT